MPITRFTLMRHGRVDGVPALYGRTDVLLNEQEQKRVANALDSIHATTAIDNVICSPLIRCHESASRFAEKHSLPLKTVMDLREMNFGDWDGVPFDALAENWSDLEAFWQDPSSIAPPSGESLLTFAERVIYAWNTLLSEADAKHHLLLVHGGTIRIILAHLLNIDWRNANLFTQLHIDYASSTRIEIGDFANAKPVVKWIGSHVD